MNEWVNECRLYLMAICCSAVSMPSFVLCEGLMLSEIWLIVSYCDANGWIVGLMKEWALARMVNIFASSHYGKIRCSSFRDILLGLPQFSCIEIERLRGGLFEHSSHLNEWLPISEWIWKKLNKFWINFNKWSTNLKMFFFSRFSCDFYLF